MTRPSAKYNSGRHCVFLIHAHLVFTPKYRKKVFKKGHLAYLKTIFASVCINFGAQLTEFNGEPNHVHLLVNYPPWVELSKLINSLKGVSSRMLRKEYPDIKKHYWKDNVLWSRSYFAASCGGAAIDTLKQYIEAQESPKL
jgi:putative transposase